MTGKSINVALIQILTGNQAFCEESGEVTTASAGAEIARILRKLADDIETGGVLFRSLYDANGNKVGDYQLAADGHTRLLRQA